MEGRPLQHIETSTVTAEIAREAARLCAQRPPGTLLDRLRAANASKPKISTAPLDDGFMERMQARAQAEFDEWQAANGALVADDDAPMLNEPARKPPDPDGLLTMKQAAAKLNVTTDQIKAFIDDGALLFINVGRGTKRPRYRFRPDELDTFIETRRQEHIPCRSIPLRNPKASIGSTSNSKVIGFTARRAARLAARPRSSKQ